MSRFKQQWPELDATIDSIFAHYQIPGAGVAVIHKGKALTKTYGHLALDNSEAVTTDTAFNIGSATKALTATAVGILVDDGKLDWDDPVHHYVPELEMQDPWLSAQLSLRDLSANRTGISRTSGNFVEFGFAPDCPPADVFKRFKYARSRYPFRDRFSYKNIGHMAVAQSVARISGLPFSQFLHERLFKPLGMDNSAAGARAAKLPKQMGWHTLLPEGMTAIPIVYGESYVGAGGAMLSLDDAVRWMRLQLEGGEVDGVRVISPSTLREIHRPQIVIGPDDIDIWNGLHDTRFAAYCLGWALCEYEGHTVIRHSGNDLGASAQICFVPDQQLAIAVFVGAAHREAPLEVGYTVLQSLLGTRQREWRQEVRSLRNATELSAHLPVPRGKPSRALQNYCGTFHHPAEGEITVSLSDNQLRADMSFGVLYSGRLDSAGGDNFTLAFDNPAARGLLPQHLANVTCYGSDDKIEGFCLMKNILGADAPHFKRQTTTKRQGR